MDLSDFWNIKISQPTSRSLILKNNKPCYHCGGTELKLKDMKPEYYSWVFHTSQIQNEASIARFKAKHDKNDHSECDAFEIDLPVLEGVTVCANGCPSGKMVTFDEDSDEWVGSLGTNTEPIHKMLQNKARAFEDHFESHITCDAGVTDTCPEFKNIISAQWEKTNNFMDKYKGVLLNKWLDMDSDN